MHYMKSPKLEGWFQHFVSPELNIANIEKVSKRVLMYSDNILAKIFSWNR